MISDVGEMFIEVGSALPWSGFPRKGRECSLLKVKEAAGRNTISIHPGIRRRRNYVIFGLPSSHM